jgi:Xaa-Pro aminopeptidase
MLDTPAIQSALKEFNIDAWLLAEFRGTNPLAQKTVGLDPAGHSTRRWAYLIPQEGSPKKLVHRIESGALDHLSGEKRVYLKWQEYEAGIAWLLSELLVNQKPAAAGSEAKPPRVAMEYSPRNMIPYISRVDGGLIELVRACGGEPVSSGDLIQQFEATWSKDQLNAHHQAERVTTSAYTLVWKFIRDEVTAGREIRETTVQDLIMHHFEKNNVVTDHPPIVGVGPHSGDPHYSPIKGSDSAITKGDFVLVDLWGKVDHPNGVYSDLTRVGYVGDTVPEQYSKIFNIVAAARDVGIDLVKKRFAANEPLAGWEVDAATRAVIEAAGYGEFFVHRTGHNIGDSTHGNGAHMDNLETRDERRVLRRTCFSIEPGIYLPEFGIRSEINVYVDENGGVRVTGGPVQTEIVPILK